MFFSYFVSSFFFFLCFKKAHLLLRKSPGLFTLLKSGQVFIVCKHEHVLLDVTHLTLDSLHFFHLVGTQGIAAFVVLVDGEVQSIPRIGVIHIYVPQAPERGARTDGENSRESREDNLPHHVSSYKNTT